MKTRRSKNQATFRLQTMTCLPHVALGCASWRAYSICIDCEETKQELSPNAVVRKIRDRHRSRAAIQEPQVNLPVKWEETNPKLYQRCGGWGLHLESEVAKSPRPLFLIWGLLLAVVSHEDGNSAFQRQATDQSIFEKSSYTLLL